MINRRFGKIVWECDECNCELETDTADFMDAVEILNEEGWEKENLGRGTWSHTCPACQQ